MKLVDVDPLIVKLNEAQIEGTDTYKGLGLAKEMLIRAKGINPSTDAVSREEALEAFRPRGISQEAWEESNVCKTIKALPTVTPERPKGEWVDDGLYAEGHSVHAYHCSKCEFMRIGYKDMIKEQNFCPNCGADMRGVSK